jgi:hypothetical protein
MVSRLSVATVDSFTGNTPGPTKIHGAGAAPRGLRDGRGLWLRGPSTEGSSCTRTRALRHSRTSACGVVVVFAARLLWVARY